MLLDWIEGIQPTGYFSPLNYIPAFLCMREAGNDINHRFRQLPVLQLPKGIIPIAVSHLQTYRILSVW